MPIKSLSDEQYDKILWDKVWAKAIQDTKGEKRKSRIVNHLCIETELTEPTFWRILEGKSRKWRRGTREILLKYLSFKTNEEFRNEVNSEREKKGPVYWKIIEIIGDDVFLNQIFSTISTSVLLCNADLFNVEDADLFFHFTKTLHYAYSNEPLFSSLSIVADRNSLIGKISMKDYFIQLSYVTKTELTTRESLVRNETELNVLKIRRSIENNQQLTKDYIVNFSLQNIRNLLVLGNPGVGKSTFCRWICNEWSRNPQTTNGVIPVYIQLKGLDFDKGENAIINYIYRNYMMSDVSEIRDLHGLLRKAHLHFCFVLDGFDELSEPQKDLLFFQLQEISSGCKYILASRPYGILNNYEIKYDQLIQLDGFDTANIHNYIDVFMQKNPTANRKTKEQLIDIIEFNPTLTDFAHNPLMLSFIVYIYLSDDNADEILRKIQTRFDLQQVVINWMFIHNKSKVAAELDAHLIEAISKVACEMEFGKIAEKTGKLSDRNFKAVLLPISQLGLGQLTENSPGNYKFYFNSISFQEYFASLFISSRITSAALEYLLQDSYFWNLAAMVLGQISSDSTSSIMGHLLSTCEEELSKEEGEYTYYKYLLLLSECRSEYLNRKLNKRILQTINRAFALNAQNEKDNKNAHLKYAFAECTQRIYNKMLDAHKKLFKEILLSEMEVSWHNPNDPLLKWDTTCRHLPILVKYLDLNLDAWFTTRCVDLLTVALEEYQGGKCEFSALWDLPDFVVSILQNNPESFFVITRTYLEKVLPLLPPCFLNFRGRIELGCIDAKIALIRLANSIHAFNTNLEKARVESLSGEIAVYAFIVGKKSIEFKSEKESSDCQYQLLSAAKIIQGYLIDRTESFDMDFINGPRPIAQLIAEGLFESGHHNENYPVAIDILAKLDDEYLFFDQIIHTNLHDYFDRLIADAHSHITTSELRRICTMLYCIPALKNKLAFHRNRISALINSYIANNTDQFHDSTTVSNINYFLRLLERGEQDIYENDRRFFIESILKDEISKLPFFANILFPRVIRKYITVYNIVYWDFILSFLDNSNESAIRTTIAMFANPSIYQFNTNLPYIQKLLIFLIQLRTQPFYPDLSKSQAENILTIISRVLKMLKQSNSAEYQMRNQVLPFTEEILKEDTFRNEILGNLKKSRQNGACNSAYILQYYFNNDASFDLEIDYWQAFSSSQRKSIVEYIYPAFVKQGSLPKSDVEILKQNAGEEFVRELQKENERMKVHQFPFNKEAFFALCSGKFQS